jgi:hypothetical protein
MSNPSNLYAEKIFAEHPAVLWSLDDKADYLSLISEEQRSVSGWAITNGSASTFTGIYDEPFPNSNVSKVIGDLTTDTYGQVVCISDDISNFSVFDKDLGTFSIGAYINSLSSYIYGVEIGYEYYDPASGSNIQHLKQFLTSVQNKWFFVSETFDAPNQNTTFRIVIKINYIGNAASTDDYHFLLNGVSLGQWSEEFNSDSLGVNKVAIPSNIYTTQPYGIEAKAYGLQEDSGYYLVYDNMLSAKNTGIPIVYGASNLTRLIPANGPSLIIPGKGLLNEDGKFNNYTLEFWAKINSTSNTPKRIVGPVSSSDGLYVHGPYMSLVVGSQNASYYVGEWARPMLIDIEVGPTSAELLINGEQVIALSYDAQSLSFPNKEENGKDVDWIGFYSYEEVSPVELDCVAIYPYKVPLIVAKRRFVYGQGVEFPEGINQAYSGSSIYIDYPFSDYSSNYSYPDLGNWSQGIVDNLSTTNNILSTPNYELPELSHNKITLDELSFVNSIIQNESDPFFTFRPVLNGAQFFPEVSGYLVFNDLNILNSQIKSFSGVFKVKEILQNKQVLFHIDSENTGNYFSIVLEGSTINYNLKYSGVESTVYSSYNILPGEIFSVALDIDKFSSYFGGSVASFFGNFSSMRMCIGGNDINDTFYGNIYKVGLSNARNHYKLLSMFNEKGTAEDYENLFDAYSQIVDYDAGDSYFGNGGGYYENDGTFVPVDGDFWQYYLDGGTPSGFTTYKFINHTSSYTLVPTNSFDSYGLDIDVSSYWEDYIPLSYFSQAVTDAKGDTFYDLDFVQFNINYPAPSAFIEEEQIGSWTYEELQSEYTSPVKRTYSSLDNQLFTGYLDYSDLKNKSSKNYKYSTDSEILRSYVTFQYVATGANAPSEYFTKIELPPKEGIVEPGLDWMNTKYEVVNNMLIYPPVSADHSTLALVTHLEFNVHGILKNKVNIKSLEYASQSFNDVAPNPIGTRFGTKIYPYKKNGIYYDYKGKNPFTIYKGSSPYLYLTRYSGIELKGKYDPLENRGLSLPINENKSENYKILALQAAVKFDQDFFPYSPTEIFEIKAKNTHIKFYMVANHPTGKRAKIYAINVMTGQLENGIGFYWNGNIVKEPVLTVKEWGFLGISFPVLLDFKNYVGSFNINGPLMFNTISHYQSTNLQEVQTISTRPWFSVKTIPPVELDWEYWLVSNYVWNGVLIRSSTSYYGVDPETIYKSYTGTNKIIVDSGKDLMVTGYKYSVYGGVTWNQTVIDAV